MKKKSKAKRKSSNDLSGKLIRSFSSGIVRLALDIVLYLFLVIALISTCKYVYNFCYQVFGSASVTSSSDAVSMSVTFYEGESTLQIAERLEGYGLILDKYSFVTKSRLDKITIKPGTFILSSDMDYDEILSVISDISQAKDEDEIQDSMMEETGGADAGESDTE